MRQASKKSTILVLFILGFTTNYLWANILGPQGIRLSNHRPSPPEAFQVLPNTQKWKVYFSGACQGCGLDSEEFSISDFQEGGARAFLRAIEARTGFKVPQGQDAIADLNALLVNQEFGQRLEEIMRDREWGEPLYFSADQFTGGLSPEKLIKDLNGMGISTPAASNSLQALNAVLVDQNLYIALPKRLPEPRALIDAFVQKERAQGFRPSPVEVQGLNRGLLETNTIKRLEERLRQKKGLDPLGIKLLNRILLEVNFPLDTPPVAALSIAQAVKPFYGVGYGYLTLEQIRSLLEEILPQETPKTYGEQYQSLQGHLPSAVLNADYVDNGHLFSHYGNALHVAFSNDGQFYYGLPSLRGFDLMRMDIASYRTYKIAHFYVGDYIVPNLRIDSMSISPDDHKIAIAMESDPISIWGLGYNDVVVLDLSKPRMKVHDLGNDVAYGGWWSADSQKFYIGCPIGEHKLPDESKICAVTLN